MFVNYLQSRCSICNEIKNNTEFYDDQSWCKVCYRERHRSRYAPKNNETDEPRFCLWCDEEYMPKQRRKSFFCSRDCKDQCNKQFQKYDRMMAKPDRNCLHCGNIMPKWMRIDASYCSDECNFKAHGATRKMYRRKNETKIKGTPLVGRVEVAKKTNYLCGICNEKVDLDVKHPDPLFGSIDHIVPLAKGGSNDLDNLQIAHLKCNLSKGARIKKEKLYA